MTSPVAPEATPSVPEFPALGDPSFNTKAFAWGNWMPTLVAWIASVVSAAYQNALSAFENADAAATASSDAQAAAVAAANASNASKWVSGTTYAEGAAVWSPVNYQGYRRKIAGAGAVDPSLDATNWALLGAVGSVPDYLLFSQGVI